MNAKAMTAGWVLLLGLLSSLLSAQPSSQGDPANLEWRYVARTGDTPESIGARYLKPDVPWTDLLRHNRLPRAFQITEGTVVRIPVRWLLRETVSASIELRGATVERRSLHSHRFEPLSEGATIRVGDELRVSSGTAVLVLPDNSRVRMLPAAHLRISELTRFGETGMHDHRLQLIKGRIENEVAPLQGPAGQFRVTLPGAIAAVRGTVFRVAVEGRQTLVEVDQGEVEIQTGRRQLQLRAGEGLALQAGGARRQDLPPPPELELPARMEESPRRLQWEGIPEATGYRLRIQGESGQTPYLEAQSSEPSIELPALDNGVYILTLRSMGPQGFESADLRLRFEVDRPAAAARLMLPDPDATLQDVRPLFVWRVEDPGLKSSLELSRDMSFEKIEIRTPFASNTTLQLDRDLSPGLWYWRVVTVAGTDRFAWSEPQSFRIPGSTSGVLAPPPEEN